MFLLRPFGELLPDLQKISRVPFVSMIDEVVAQVDIDKINKVVGIILIFFK